MTGTAAEPAGRSGERHSLVSMLRALFGHRDFVASLVRREFQLRNARALWGGLWLVIEPAAQVLIYTLIFGRVLGAKLPGAQDPMAYGIYVCAGLITWTYFADLVGRGQTIFLDHADLLKTVRFPRSVLPAALLIAATINFVIVSAIFLAVLLLTGAWPGLSLLGALPLLTLQAMMGLGLGVLTGSLNVFFRDTGRVVGVGMQFWFWLTPIVYPLSIVPERLRPLFDWNPLAPLAAGYQRIAVEHAAPEWSALAYPACVALLLVGAALFVFRRLGPDLVDEL